MISRQQCEYLRIQAKTRFDQVKMTWIDCGRWVLPHRTRWLQSQIEGQRSNQHIVDASHLLAHRSYVAGFLEGNTSATRPWYRYGTPDPDTNRVPANHEWLDRFTRRTLQVLSSSNFYDAVGVFYSDFGVFNTGAYYIEERQKSLHFHALMPGAYYAINNGYNEAVVLVREFRLSVKALVDTYGQKNKSGKIDWSNISVGVKKMYEDGIYTQPIDIVHLIKENDEFDPSQPVAGLNRQWISYTYELGPTGALTNVMGVLGASGEPMDQGKYLNISASKRKPFIVGKSSSDNFEYGEKGPTLDALGCIKSLNKKAIGKDQALEHMLRPALQGPANLRKSYITSAPNSYVPLDPMALAQKGLRSIFEINPAIQFLIGDVTDLRDMVEKIFYADYLLYLSRNPKTRTATETNAVVNEQQLIIGPNLQSLNWTHNVPITEFVADYVLFEDPVMKQFPVPEALQGQFLRPEFISVFAQAQRAADLPSIERFMQFAEQVAPVNPGIWDKVNVDKICDVFEDRLFLPAGINNPQDQVDAKRQQAQAQMRRQQMLQETLPAVAGAAKDVGLKVNQQ